MTKFKKTFTIMLACFTAVTCFLFPHMHVNASDISYIDISDWGPYSGVGHLQLMPDGNVFDSNYYAWAHPEVAYVVGGDTNALYQHYLSYGQNLGWVPYAISYDNVPAPIPMQGYWAEKQLLAFSALINNGHILENSRLAGISSDWITIHCSDNINGYRTTADSSIHVDESALFDASYYALMNPDVVVLYGNSKAALWNHYKTIGVYEGRPVAGITDEVNAKILATQIAASIITPDMSEIQKITAVHDWMIGYGQYDLDMGEHCRDIQGFIFNKSGVCHGYAVTFEYFMTLLDIPCQVVLGDSSGNHSWNRVLVNGQWLYVDVAKDDPVMFKGGFTMYFNGINYTVNANGPRLDHYSNFYLLKTEDQMWNHTIQSFEQYF